MKPDTILTRIMPICLLTLCLFAVGACGRNNSSTEAPAAVTAADEASAAGTATPAPAAGGDNDDSSAAADMGDRPAATLEPSARNDMYAAPPEQTIDPDKVYYATVETEKGDIEIQLFAKRAPKTVNNFVFLARQGFYDNVMFFRVLDGFMAQGGDPRSDGSGGPGYTFEDEIVPGLEFDQSGLLAMANRGPATNGSQFFITFAPADWLTGLHTIFGKVIEGEEVLGQLTRRDPRENPDFEGDKIVRITIEERDESVLPTPTPAPPTATPTSTPTPYAPTEMDNSDRPLAERSLDERVNVFNIPPEMVIDTSQLYTATISTNKGDMVATLYAAAAPQAVNNFVVLANLGFYDNTSINLVIPDDSIVIGAPDNNSLNDAGYRFPAEIGVEAATDVGAMAYIRFEQQADGEILSSSSQILIALIDPPPAANLQFSFFAQIVEGVDVLPQLTTEDTIQSITITSGPAN